MARYTGVGIWRHPVVRVTKKATTSIRWELFEVPGLTLGMMRDFLDACEGIEDEQRLRAITTPRDGTNETVDVHLEVFFEVQES